MPTCCISSIARSRALPPAVAEPHARPFCDLVAHAHHRVEGGQRLLEDHRDLVTAYLPQAFRRHASEVCALEEDLASGEARLAWEEADERPQRHRLSGAGFPDEAERLAAAQVEGGAVDCADEAARERELHAQVADVEDRVVHSGRRRSARPSASSDSPRAVKTIARPGMVASSQLVVR